MLPRLVMLVALSFGALSPAAQTPPGFTVTPLLDNATLTAVRLKIAPGAKEQPHTHAYPMLVVVLTAGEMEVHNGEARTKGPRKAGDIEFVSTGLSHSVGNIGTTPLDALVFAIKPDRVRGGTAPPRQALPGIMRKPLLDKPDLTVTRLEFAADVRESVHTHPYDLAVVPTMQARLDVQVGHKKEVRAYKSGEIIYIPRNVPHAVANAATTSSRILAIVIK
jgi:quercetin dioxygenase-like cupin family protein